VPGMRRWLPCRNGFGFRGVNKFAASLFGCFCLIGIPFPAKFPVVGQGRRYLFVLAWLAAAVTSGCVTATNTLSLDDVGQLRITGVTVAFAPDARIMWGDGERAYAASRGQPATESDALARTPEGQAYLRNTIATKVKGAMERNLTGALSGARAARVEVNVKSVTVASAIQRVLVGGHHDMVADVTLVDAKTGAVILPYAAQSKMSMAGQGVAGVLVDAAVMAEPIDRVVNNYAEQYGNWLLRRAGPEPRG